MFDVPQFQEWMQRVRAGDEQAAALIVEHFAPELRRVVRLRLTDPFLRRLVDSSDICQSVLANFFLRAALGQFELSEPRNLFNLLVTMARNKVLNLARDRKKEKTARQMAHDPAPLEQAPARETEPAADYRELLAKARGLLTPEETQLAEDRLAGKSWQDIALDRSETPDKCRKQYRRALDRVALQLGLAEPS